MLEVAVVAEEVHQVGVVLPATAAAALLQDSAGRRAACARPSRGSIDAVVADTAGRAISSSSRSSGGGKRTASGKHHSGSLPV